MISPKKLIVLTAIAGCLLPTIGCTAPDPTEPESGTFEWVTYENGAVGFALDVPNVYTADTQADGYAVLFRADRSVPVKVYWTTEVEAKAHGLWFGHTPVADIVLAGLEGRYYEYTHCDGPFCSPMKSYVVPLRGRFLALEFRSARPLHGVNQRILNSFTIVAASPS